MTPRATSSASRHAPPSTPSEVHQRPPTCTSAARMTVTSRWCGATYFCGGETWEGGQGGGGVEHAGIKGTPSSVSTPLAALCMHAPAGRGRS